MTISVRRTRDSWSVGAAALAHVVSAEVRTTAELPGDPVAGAPLVVGATVPDAGPPGDVITAGSAADEGAPDLGCPRTPVGAP